MTREEIENTHKILDCMLSECIIAESRKKLLKRLEEICKLAIQALEQEPCEDCISRKDIYFKLTNGAYSNETIEQFIDRLVKELEALPPVNPQEPKQGHWIMHLDDLFPMESTMECSECGIAMGLYDVKNYCPNCGSRNEVEQ